MDGSFHEVETESPPIGWCQQSRIKFTVSKLDSSKVEHFGPHRPSHEGVWWTGNCSQVSPTTPHPPPCGNSWTGWSCELLHYKWDRSSSEFSQSECSLSPQLCGSWPSPWVMTPTMLEPTLTGQGEWEWWTGPQGLSWALPWDGLSWFTSEYVWWCGCTALSWSECCLNLLTDWGFGIPWLHLWLWYCFPTEDFDSVMVSMGSGVSGGPHEQRICAMMSWAPPNGPILSEGLPKPITSMGSQ